MDSIAKNLQQPLTLKQWAHDVRSPLLSLEILKQTLPDIPSEHKTLMNLAIERIRDMTQEILYSNSSAAGRASVAQAIDRVVSLKWLEIADRPGITLKVSMGQNVRSAEVYFSTSSLERILSNLINNAIESIADKGSVSISLITHQNESYILIEDTGCGMSSDTLQSIQRQTPLRSQKPGGLGLGLLSAQTHIQKAGGRMDISSIENVGTSIKIRLPLAAQFAHDRH